MVVDNVTRKPTALEYLRGQLTHNLKQYSMFIALIGIGLIFTVLTGGTFLTARNLSNLFLQTSFIAILAVGMVLVIVAGHIDLSVGSIAGFTGGIAAVLHVYQHWGPFPAILAALFAGVLIGIWQGYWIAYRGVPAFIVTLSGMLVFRGALIALTKGQTVAPLAKSFSAIGDGYLPRLFTPEGIGFHDTTMILAAVAIIAYLIFEFRARNRRIRYGFEIMPTPVLALKIAFMSVLIASFFAIMILYRGMPYSILIVGILVLLFSFITNNTIFGRHVYAIGGSKEAARLSGINIRSRTMMIFVIMGTLSALSGIVFTARLNSATASAGNLFELDTIAAAIIGGTSTVGGEGTIVGAIIGALVMASLNNGMSLMNISAEYQQIVKGLILLLAVWFDISQRMKKS